MGSNTFPQQQSMGQMQMPQMAPMQQQDQQSGFAGMYAPQYGAFSPMAGGMAMSGGMQGYGGGQSVPNYAPQGRLGMAMTPSGQNVYPDMSKMTQQDVYTGYDPSNYKLTEGYAAAVANGTEGLYRAEPDNLQFPQQLSQQQQADYIAANPNAPRAYGGSQSVPNYQVPQIQQQPMAGYGGYAQQPMQQNPYGGGKVSSRQGPQRLY
jgi:hypothetical protein